MISPKILLIFSLSGFERFRDLVTKVSPYRVATVLPLKLRTKYSGIPMLFFGSNNKRSFEFDSIDLFIRSVSNAAICYTAMDSIHRSAYVVGLYQGLDAGIRFGGKLEHYEREAKGLSKLDHSQSQNVTKSVNLRHLLVFLATWL